MLRRAHGDSGRCAERWNAGQRVGEEWKAGPSCRLGREGKGEREVERAGVELGVERGEARLMGRWAAVMWAARGGRCVCWAGSG